MQEVFYEGVEFFSAFLLDAEEWSCWNSGFSSGGGSELVHGGIRDLRADFHYIVGYVVGDGVAQSIAVEKFSEHSVLSFLALRGGVCERSPGFSLRVFLRDEASEGLLLEFASEDVQDWLQVSCTLGDAFERVFCVCGIRMYVYANRHRERLSSVP